MVGAQAALTGSIRARGRWLVTLVLVSTLSPGGARAQAPENARFHEGTLAVERAEGHDCVPPISRTIPVELAIGTPGAADAILGFGDGNIARANFREGRIAIGDDGFALIDAQRAAGTGVALRAPGTEACRWSGTIRLQPRALADARERTQALSTRAAAEDVLTQGVALLEQGKAAEGRLMLEQGAALRASVLGDEHWLTLRAQLRVSRGLQLEGKPDAALALTQRILAVQMRAADADPFERLRTQAGVGLMLWSSGRPADALPVIQQVFDELRNRYGPRHLETLTTENNLGLVLWDLARLDEAAAHLENLLPAVIEIRGEQHPRTLDAMNNLGLIYQGLGRHAEALELLERAYRLGVASVGADHRDTLSTLANVAVGYAALDRMEDALALYRVAYAGLRKTVGDDHPWTLIMQSNIGASLLDLRRVDEALPLAIDLVPRAERAMGLDHLYTMRWITLLGSAYQLSGNPAAALAQYRRALELQRKALGDDNRDTLETLTNIGQVEFDSGMRREGVATLERAVDELRRVAGAGHRLTLNATVGLANAEAAMGDRAKAIRLLSGVVAAVETLRADEGLARETRQAFFARWSGGYKRLAFLLAQHDMERAFRAAELSKARTLLESIALRNADMAGILEAADAERLARFDARASELTNAVAQAPTPEEGFRLESQRNGVVREASAFRRDLRARYPRYAQLSEVELIDASAAAGLPRRNEGFVSYLVLDDEVLAFVATRGAALRVVELGSIPGLESTIGAYRRLLAGPLATDPLPVWRLRNGSFVAALARPDDAVQRVTDPRSVGEALARRLVRPLEKTLAGATRWVISPDGALATLPFEALPRDGRPLAATRMVTYVQSLSVAALMQARPAAGTASHDLLAMGAPQFVATETGQGLISSRAAEAPEPLAASLARGALPGGVASGPSLRGRRWSPLPGAAREIEAVSALFPPERRVVATGASASEARLRALDASGELADFRYLLFATHAYLDTEVPARSALVLSQVDLAPGTDGYLTAAKWPAFRLRSDLAVLSACETGLGRAVQGEGVMGLPYALFIAGNRATLLTLWRIDDAGTVAFVSAFFDRLRAGMDPPTALALTKRSFISDPSRRHSAAVWAPFVLYGR